MNSVEMAGRLDDERGLGTRGCGIAWSILNLDIAMRSAESGKSRDNGGMRDAGQRLKQRQELIIETLPGWGVLITFVGKIHARGHELVPWHETIGGKGLQQLMDEDSGAGEEYQRECELQHNQNGGEVASATSFPAACAFLEDFIEVNLGGA